MKEENSSSQEEIYNVEQKLVNYSKRMMLIPFGYPFNFDLMEKVNAGTKIITGNGMLIEVQSSSILNTASQIADTISFAIYGRPMRDIVRAFKNRYGDNIQTKNVILITYDIM
jgi:hypothetical protein